MVQLVICDRMGLGNFPEHIISSCSRVDGLVRYAVANAPYAIAPAKHQL
ncbi:MAG TPA: hypothetical protein V6D12_22205 [Candidatus Obscuribacterales bacterium]